MKRVLSIIMLGAWTFTVHAQTDTLFQDTLQLSEVVVKGTLPKTHVKGDALVTRIAGTTLEHAGTTMDMLDKLPQVNADNREQMQALYPRMTYHELDSCGHFIMMEEAEWSNRELNKLGINT